MSIIICCYILIQTKVCHSDERKEKILTFHVLDKASKIKKSSSVLLVFDVHLTNTIAIKKKEVVFVLILWCCIALLFCKCNYVLSYSVYWFLFFTGEIWLDFVSQKNWDLENLSIFVKMLRINLKLKKIKSTVCSGFYREKPQELEKVQGQIKAFVKRRVNGSEVIKKTTLKTI